MFFLDAFEAIQDYMNMGGPILIWIALLAFAMSTLVVERFWYFNFGGMRRDVNEALRQWEDRAERTSWHAHRVREKLISEASEQISLNLGLVKTMVMLAPLFGLLGTVTGMIQVFEIMAITGGGDARQMAGGVFRATIPTLSGMVVAIYGVFANTYLDRVSNREMALLEDHLTMDH